MSSVATIRSDLDSSGPIRFERNPVTSGKAALLFQLSKAACARLDEVLPFEAMRDDLVR